MKPEAAIGLGFTVLKVFMDLVMAVMQTNDKVILFKSELADLSKTLTALHPAIEQLGQLNDALGISNDELEDLIEIMEEGTKLVKESSSIFILDFVNMFYHGRNLRILVTRLDYFFKYRMQTLIARDVKHVAVTVRTIQEKLNIMWNLLALFLPLLLILKLLALLF